MLKTKKIAHALFRTIILFVVAMAPAMADINLLQDVEYKKIRGDDAIKVIFSVPVRYQSHSPKNHGKQLNISLETTEPDLEKVYRRRVQTLAPPETNRIPLLGIALMLEDREKRLVVRFKREVHFSVSQIEGPNSITITLHDEISPRITKQIREIIPKQTQGSVDLAYVEKLMSAARQELTKGRNKKAIPIFTKILGLPVNKYSREAMELLGVARERNNQLAHAKAIYLQYMKLYPEGEDTDRVKQRYAELISSQLTPKGKLERTEQRDTGLKSSTLASFGQFYTYGEVDADETGREINLEELDTLLSVNQRLRWGNFDVRNNFSAIHQQDFLDEEGEGKINSLYSKIKNTLAGVYLTLGRQPASTAGPIYRFDGLLMGIDLTEGIQLNYITGFPVDVSNKQRVQQEKIFHALNLEFVEYWKNLNITPYILTQEIHGITDREVIGTQVRYYPEKGNLFLAWEHDTLYDEMNVFMARGQYPISEQTGLVFNADIRKNPPLETGNAAAGEIVTIDELIASNSIAELQQQARERTGEVELYTVRVNHQLNNTMDVNADYTITQYTNAFVVDGQAVREQSEQQDMTAELVMRELFRKSDSTIFRLTGTTADDFDELLFSVNHNIRLPNRWRFQGGMTLRDRQNNNDTAVQRIIPRFKAEYQGKNNSYYLFETYYEMTRYDHPVEPDFNQLLFTLGYNWGF